MEGAYLHGSFVGVLVFASVGGGRPLDLWVDGGSYGTHGLVEVGSE